MIVGFASGNTSRRDNANASIVAMRSRFAPSSVMPGFIRPTMSRHQQLNAVGSSRSGTQISA